MANHFVSATCQGVKCHVCKQDATHKVGEEIAFDDPNQMGHNLTTYLCCFHFTMIMGPATPCNQSRVSHDSKGLSYLNDHQSSWTAYLASLPPDQKCDCGWYRRGECYGTCFNDPSKGGALKRDDGGGGLNNSYRR